MLMQVRRVACTWGQRQTRKPISCMQRKSVTVSALAADHIVTGNTRQNNYNHSHGHTHVIYVQVLVLNHELATLHEEMPYLAAIWHPMPVVQFWGRSASRQLPCDKEHAVFHWHDCE